MHFRHFAWVCSMSVGLPLAAQTLQPPLKPGQAVVTCYSGDVATNPVFAIVDHVDDPAGHGAVVNQDWKAATIEHNDPSWTLQGLGSEVFGVALDDAPKPNIYLSSTTIYQSNWFGNFRDYNQTTPGRGQIYKVDGNTWTAAPLLPTPLPNTGQGLGNLAYDPVNRQLLVTNFHDGKIYRVDPSTGALRSPNPVFDPVFPEPSDPPTPDGFAPLGERLWGIGVFNNRVYLARWRRDFKSGSDNEIWSVGLDSVGAMTGTLQREIVLHAATEGYMPVSDITFTKKGRMLVAQHGMNSNYKNNDPYQKDIDGRPHEAFVLEYVLNTSTGKWDLQPVPKFQIGIYPGYSNRRANAAGGVSWSCPLIAGEPAWMVATGDALKLNTEKVYGIQITPATGGKVENSYILDINQSTDDYDKTEIGDVEVYNVCEGGCAEVTPVKILCAADGTGDYFVTLSVKNLTPDTIHHIWLLGLPSTVSANPSYFNLDLLGTPIPPNGTITLPQIRIHGASPGNLSFILSIHNINLEQCCALNVNIQLPDCGCAQVTSSSGPFCSWFFGTGYYFFFTLQNLFPDDVKYVLITPEPPSAATFNQNLIEVSPQLVQYGSASLFTQIGNVKAGDRVCLRITTMTENFKQCCSIRYCVTIPRCFIDWGDPLPNVFTTLALSERSLILQSPQGDPGITFPLSPDTEGIDLEWLPIEESLPDGSFIEQRLRGSVDGSADRTIATMRTTRTGTSGTELSTGFPGFGTTSHRYEFLRGGNVIGTRFGVTPEVPAQCNCGPKLPTRDIHLVSNGFVSASHPQAAVCNAPAPLCAFASYTFKTPFQFALAGISGTYNADEVRIYPENGIGNRVQPSGLDFVAHGPTRVTLTDLHIDADCNDNGVADSIDIANRTSIDADSNGIPDECEGRPPNVAVSLNTGLDQDAGLLLPVGALPNGTDDEDWLVTSPGPAHPAKVVINPYWPAPFSNSRWISFNADRGKSPAGTNTYVYQRCFELGSSATNIVVDLRMKADNEAAVFVNNRKLAEGGAFFNPYSLGVHQSGAVGDGLFVTGTNCVRVEVKDFGVVTGFTMTGNVTASEPEAETLTTYPHPTS